MSYKKFTNEPCFLWSYWTKVHEIFIRYRSIIHAVNVHIEVAISHSMSECQSDKWGYVILPHSWLPWQRPLRYWKKISDLSSTPKTLSCGVKIAKIAHGLCFACDTKLVAMATSLEESEKLDRIEKTHANAFHLVKKIVKIGPVNTEIALLIVKKIIVNKKKKLQKVKYIARSASLLSGLNKSSKSLQTCSACHKIIC